MRALFLGLLSVLMTQSVFAKDNDPSVRPDIQIKTIENVGFNGAGNSDEVSFEIPPSTKSFLIQYAADSDTAGIDFTIISNPEGHIVAGQPFRKFDYEHKDLIGKSPEREWENPTDVSNFSGMAMAFVPNLSLIHI